jgi:hypothetical protein
MLELDGQDVKKGGKTPSLHVPSWPSSSGLRGRRRTYLTILELVDHALFKIVKYVLLCLLRPEPELDAKARQQLLDERLNRHVKVNLGSAGYSSSQISVFSNDKLVGDMAWAYMGCLIIKIYYTKMCFKIL